MARCWKHILVLSMVAAAGCATSDRDGPSQAGARPHYKVGQPYQVAGRWYQPRVDKAYDEIGIASWYGDAFHGKLTANGEIFDKSRLSAAHKTLPMPILVEVENLENGRRAVLRLNDRGPFVDDRLIDLSHAAADELGFTQKGLARVRVRYVAEAALYALAEKRGGRRQPETTSPDDPIGALIARETPLDRTGEGAIRGYWVELGVYDDLAALDAAKTRAGPDAAVANVDGAPLSRALRRGPYADYATALGALARALDQGFAEARVVAGAGVGA
jgi:rare lipoprotein A